MQPLLFWVARPSSAWAGVFARSDSAADFICILILHTGENNNVRH
jgi:hypothetical protein